MPAALSKELETHMGALLGKAPPMGGKAPLPQRSTSPSMRVLEKPPPSTPREESGGMPWG